MGWRGGETPLAILFFFFAKSVTFRGVFLIDVIFVQKVSQYHPLHPCCLVHVRQHEWFTGSHPHKRRPEAPHSTHEAPTVPTSPPATRTSPNPPSTFPTHVVWCMYASMSGSPVATHTNDAPRHPTARMNHQPSPPAQLDGTGHTTPYPTTPRHHHHYHDDHHTKNAPIKRTGAHASDAASNSRNCDSKSSRSSSKLPQLGVLSIRHKVSTSRPSAAAGTPRPWRSPAEHEGRSQGLAGCPLPSQTVSRCRKSRLALPQPQLCPCLTPRLPRPDLLQLVFYLGRGHRRRSLPPSKMYHLDPRRQCAPPKERSPFRFVNS